MTNDRLRELLTELEQELRSTSEVDAETRKLMSDLNADIETLAGSSENPAVARARELESRFAADHPVAERIAREIADLLAKMGI